MLEIFAQAKSKKASDVHLTVDSPPMFRVQGVLYPVGERLSATDTETIAKRLVGEEHWAQFVDAGDMDAARELTDGSRLRVNVFRERGHCSVAARLVPAAVPTLEELDLPPVLKWFCQRDHGLMIVTGPTGSGKSTTLAAMVDYINTTRSQHVITLEDPIEYVHAHKRSLVTQREVGVDVKSFAVALRAAMRQDPDVILLGEMRDAETIHTAITAAETGHLVLASLHAQDTVQALDRIIDVFAPSEQAQIRTQLSALLSGITSQRLYVTRRADSRVAAMEILINTPAVSNLIRTNQIHQIRSVLQTHRALGMQTMEMHLRELVERTVLDESVPSAETAW
ncbi:MAG: PilT/PilU family type 4a pilus ATPase [Firmicutes bacterium]|nr:PilT/PilU family type 4a pilus ATPase [Bacillota bacterium]